MIRILLSALVLLSSSILHAQSRTGGIISIVARDSATGDLGIAVESTLPAAGAFVPVVQAGAGAVAIAGSSSEALGSQAIAQLSRGMDARQTVESLLQGDSSASSVQIGVVDALGYSYSKTGTAAPAYAGNLPGPGYTVQAMGAGGDAVIKSMARIFEITPGDLADRLLAALDAAEKAGGIAAPARSAGLIVVRSGAGLGSAGDRLVDIRVDDDAAPLQGLKRLYASWQDSYLLDARFRSVDELNREKKFAAAQAELRRIANMLNQELRRKPDDPEVLNSVAWKLATYDLDRERALELAKRAVALAPGKADYLNTMAECHYRLGHFDEAVAIEAELVNKNPTNDLYWKQLQKFKDAKSKQ